jgi:predicted MFS family arabinose efflux permease
MVTGSCLLSLTGYGVLMWGYEFFGRVHGMSPVDIGVSMAVIVGVGGSVGTYVGGATADRLARDDVGAYMRFPATVTLIGLPFAFVFLLADSTALSLTFFFPFYLLSNMYVPAMHTINQNLARLRMRATAAAILLFIVNIVGAGAGPFFVGLLNDLYASRYGAEAIRYSLLTIAATGIFGALCLYLSSRALPGDLEDAGREVSP